jgi:hypothetical protein
LNGSTYKGTIRVSLGGVGRNIFDCLSRLGHKPLFLSAVGNDTNGKLITNNNPLTVFYGNLYLIFLIYKFISRIKMDFLNWNESQLLRAVLF